MMAELNLASQKREIPSPLKNKQKSYAHIEDTMNSPLIHLNPSITDSNTVQPIKKHHGPSNSLSDPFNYYSNEDIWRKWNNNDVAGLAAYMANADVAYDATGSLRKIGNQRWVHLFLHGYEGWAEWRRTGFPNFLAPAPN
ncbi:MAG: SusD/RagB family nutrient-binding outer membrane lipoprotein, partial [Sphingobacteriaceae bacterium]